MTENDAAELPEMMVAEVVEVVVKEAPPIIPAQELEIETVKEKETVTEIEQLAKIKMIIHRCIGNQKCSLVIFRQRPEIQGMVGKCIKNSV